MTTGVSLLPAVCEHVHTRTHLCHPALGSSVWLPKKAVTPGDLASDGAREQAAKEKGHGRATTPPGAQVRVPVCSCVGVRARTRDANYPFPTEPSGTFSSVYYPPNSLPYLRGPLEPLTQSWARQERKGRGWQERNLPRVGPRAPLGADCASELPLAGPTSHRCPHPCSRPSGHSL